MVLVQGRRVAFVGANGQGKSTLLRLMLGQLNPTSGNMTVSPHARIGCFAQHDAEELITGKGDASALCHMQELFEGGMYPYVLSVACTNVGTANCKGPHLKQGLCMRTQSQYMLLCIGRWFCQSCGQEAEPRMHYADVI